MPSNSRSDSCHELIAAEDPSRRRAAIWVFFLVAFGVPWAGWLAIPVFGIDPDSGLGTALFITGDACSVAGFIATYVAAGDAGVRRCLVRGLRLRAPIFWWLFALFLPIVWQVAARALYGAYEGAIGTIQWPAFGQFFASAVLANFLAGPLGEEFGWRGFLLPRRMTRSSALASSLFVGMIWAVWHAPLYYPIWRADPGQMASFLASVTCMSVLLTGLYVGTRGNLLLCILMHWTINASQMVLGGVLPDVRAVGLAYSMVELAVLLVPTGLVGWWLVRRRRNGAASREEVKTT